MCVISQVKEALVEYKVVLQFYVESPSKASATEVANDIADSVYKEYEFDSSLLEVVEID